MRAQRADPELSLSACAALSTLSSTSEIVAKQLVRLGVVKSLMLTMRAHLKVEDLQRHAAATIASIAAASDACRRLLIVGHAVPML